MRRVAWPTFRTGHMVLTLRILNWFIARNTELINLANQYQIVKISFDLHSRQGIIRYDVYPLMSTLLRVSIVLVQDLLSTSMYLLLRREVVRERERERERVRHSVCNLFVLFLVFLVLYYVQCWSFQLICSVNNSFNSLYTLTCE